MLLKDIQETYYTYSGTLSSVFRQYSLGGIALIWLFRSTIAGGVDTESAGTLILFPNTLFNALILLVASLILDFTQYVIQTMTWSIYSTVKEREFKKQKKDKDIEKIEFPGCINYIPLLFFWGKIITCAIGFFYIMWFMTTVTISYPH
ncbi:TPA: hypothetical protein ACJIKU_000591 [Citrobacter freundii]|uniref:hypothetical protein n=1 Tax=Citrobacter freundii TaxID=546 RepID=UPI0028BD20A7|nr:hypothetical protein [Citrobacter freundii]MDT7375835.1 hypothetical protein [Citrobacter freundii]